MLGIVSEEEPHARLLELGRRFRFLDVAAADIVAARQKDLCQR